MKEYIYMKTKYLNSKAVWDAFNAGCDYDDIAIAIADELADIEAEHERDEEYNVIVTLIDKYNKTHPDERLMLSNTTSTPCINNSTTFTLKYDADDAAIRKFVESLK